MFQFQCAKQVRIYADVDGKFYYIRILSDIILLHVDRAIFLQNIVCLWVWKEERM